MTQISERPSYACAHCGERFASSVKLGAGLDAHREAAVASWCEPQTRGRYLARTTMTPELAPVLLDGPAIARALGVHPVSVRRWAAARQITRRGTDARGRALYDLDEVQARATRARLASDAVP